MVWIREITLMDFLADKDFKLPDLGMYLAGHALKSEGAILGALQGEAHEKRLMGILIMGLSKSPSIDYIFVKEECRGKGIAMMLVEGALAYAGNKKNSKVQAKMVMQNPYANAVDHIMKKEGFKVYGTASIIRCANNERCRRGWAEFKSQHGNKIMAYLKSHGFETISFEEAPDSAFEKLKATLKSDFPQNLDPFYFILHQTHRVVGSCSFITMKDGKPAAFLLTTTADNRTLVVQQLSIAFRHQGKGVFLLPAAAWLDKFLSENTYHKAAAVIYDSNIEMKKLLDHFLMDIVESIKLQNLYQKEL